MGYKDVGGGDSPKVWSNLGLTIFRSVTTSMFKRIRRGLVKRIGEEMGANV